MDPRDAGAGAVNARADASDGQAPAYVEAALAAAQIPASKLGAARRARLNATERELYFWILRRFASSGRPSRSELDAAAGRVGTELKSALATLAREDLVHVDEAGEITVAYPFSGGPTAHRVRFPGGHAVYAMCAIDALGIAPMLGQRIQIASRDPLTRAEIEVELAPDGEASRKPEDAVVICGVSGRGVSSSSCCPVLNFFASAANAERWLAAQPDVSGMVVAMEDAITLGRIVFGDVLKDE
jgi:Alkylmercury lyase